MVTVFAVNDMDFPDTKLQILQSGDFMGWRSKACMKEPETVEWIRSFQEGSILWDVGASVGPYSLIAAALGHHVVAFEPFLPSVGELQQNVWLNKLGDKIDVFPIALGNQNTTELRFPISQVSPGSASHNDKHKSDEQAVVMIKAKEITGTWPHHVKIDVDGGELDVIEGGREVWNSALSVMVESEPPAIDDISLILQGCGMKLEHEWRRMGNTNQHNYLFRRQ